MSCKCSTYFVLLMWYLLIANTTFAYTHADTLRGSNGRGRDWWDVQKYDLQVKFDTATKSISGTTNIYFNIIKPPKDSMQIDLQDSLQIDEVLFIKDYCVPNYQKHKFDSVNIVNLSFSKEDNVYWLKYPFSTLAPPYRYSIEIKFHGKPRLARNAPWDGGFIWGKDSAGKAWISVACQGLGASAWWPCKDAQWDEPDDGMTIHFVYSKELSLVSNGRLVDSGSTNELNRCTWELKNSINNYDVTFYLEDYVHWHDTIMGEKGKLDLDFYALRYNEAKAREQFKIVKPMLHCFEYWMGLYPFYEDGYKLVESSYLGMEHQSAVAYGNNYKMGYRGMDRSGSGVGLLFDFIIVHESGHEWFGNNVTASDIADNWIHEGITTYTETLLAECEFGKEKAFEYCRGEWRNIRNDRPVIGDYGVNSEGSNDMYDKGSAVIHMIRMMMQDDEKFRGLLRAINKTYYHKIVSSKELEKFIINYTGLVLNSFFNQYLRSKEIPELEYYVKDGNLYYHFNKVVAGFSLPLEATDGDKIIKIKPTEEWQHSRWKGGFNISFSKDFLFKMK